MDENVARLLKLARDSIRGARVLLKEKLPGQAASRAYYAMFYVAQALLLSKGLAFSKHGAVISRFGKEFSKTKLFNPIYHRYLIEGFEDRHIADYGRTEDIDHTKASQHLQHAKDFLREAELFLRKPKTKNDK